MAIGKITYDNKEAIQNDTSVPEKNKVTDANMNEIKQVINDNANELITTQNNIEDLQEGQGTADVDIANLKNRVSILETDNSKNKSDISELQLDNETNKENISTLQEQFSNFENYDDTEIKQDIEEIKQEQIQQNTNIEQLKQENEQLKNALINIQTEQSKSLHIADASTIPAQLEVLGNQEQEIREGNNLWNDTSIENKKVSELSSTQVSSSNLNLTAGDYCFRLFFTDNTYMQTNVSVLLKNNENVTIKTMSINSYVTLTEEETQQIVSGICYTNTTGLEEYKSKTIAGLILTKGITFADKYEQYGASPSPDYPSPVVCLGSNKNLFDKDNANILDLYINQDGNIYATTNRKLLYIECKENTNYAVSKIAGQYFRVGSCSIIPANNIATINKDVSHETDTKIVLNSGEGAKYLVVGYYHADNDTLTEQEILDSIKVEEGIEATNYSPYGQGSTEIKKINKNFFISKEIDTTINGVKIVCNNGVLTLDGKATNSVSFDFDIFSLKKGIYKNTRGVVSGKATGSFQSYLRNEDGSYFIKEDESFELQEEKKLKYRFFANPNAVFEKYTMIPQVEKGLVSTTPETHKEKSKILPIQQEMLKGDYFVKEEDGWKEVHNKPELILDGSDDENWALNSYYNNVFSCDKLADISQNETDLICNITNNFFTNGNEFNSNTDGLVIGTKKINFKMSNVNTLEELKQYLSATNIKLYYKTTTPTKLACTEEQSAVLEELNNLDLFDGTNNIITAEDIALLKLNYIADTKLYIGNLLNSQVAESEN